MPERHRGDADMVRRLTRWERLGLAALFVFGVFVVGSAVFVWTGYYNISAKSEHWDVTTQILETVRDQSIYARTENIAVPDLDDPDMVALGAEHYRGGCAGCHGMPGEERNPVVGAMLPAPPDLAYALDTYDESALFWLIDNGIKYTGMPSWAGENRADEVWPIVAYLVSVHDQNRPQSPIPETGNDGEPIDTYGFQVLGQCARCHGDAETGPIGDLVPDLAGQPPDYLTRALVEYRDGVRQSGYMEPAAFGLTDAEITAFAAYFSQLPSRSDGTEAASEQIARGAQIALGGVPENDVPACTTCHGNGSPDFPNLAGQAQRYLEGQLALWNRGGRDATAHGQIMAVIAERLDTRQIQDVSAYFASLDASETEDGS